LFNPGQALSGCLEATTLSFDVPIYLIFKDGLEAEAPGREGIYAWRFCENPSGRAGVLARKILNEAPGTFILGPCSR